jgi:3-oxoacyl-[acyl-carrier protein] reductase
MFLRKGASVGICAKNPDKLAEAERLLREDGEVEAMSVDVRDMEQVQRFVNKVLERFGRIDVLVNNAGRVWVGDFADQTPTSIDEVIDVNVKGVMYVTHAVLPTLLHQKSGVIVNVSSGAGLSGRAGAVSYSTSKFGVVGFTESLGDELREHGIRVHAVCPGRVATDMQVEYSGKKMGMPPEKVAAEILRLAGRRPPVETGKYVVLR